MAEKRTSAFSLAPKSKLDWALDHAKRGWSVLPLHFVTAKGRCSCGQPARNCKPGKHPLTTPIFKHGYEDATLDIEIIKKTWTQYSQANIGNALGEHVALDVDYRHGGQESLHTLEAKYGPLPSTVKVLTGSGDGSQHIIMLAPNSGTKAANMARVDGLPGLELKATGYIVAVGSVTQHPYVWLPGASPDDITIARMPEWLLDLGQQPFKDDKALDKQKREYPPLTAAENEKALAKALEHCAFLQRCGVDAKVLPEPEWAAMVELLTFFGTPGEQKIHELSRPYPRYSETETDSKIKNAEKATGEKSVGPWTCLKIEHELGFSCPADCLARQVDTKTPVTMAIKVVTAREGPPLIIISIYVCMMLRYKNRWKLNVTQTLQKPLHLRRN
jgi:hypothetical protein